MEAVVRGGQDGVVEGVQKPGRHPEHIKRKSLAVEGEIKGTRSSPESSCRVSRNLTKESVSKDCPHASKMSLESCAGVRGVMSRERITRLQRTPAETCYSPTFLIEVRNCISHNLATPSILPTPPSSHQKRRKKEEGRRKKEEEEERPTNDG